MRAPFLCALAVLISTPALAGDRTSTPTWLRGDVQIGYDGDLGFGRLLDRTEAGGARVEVARSNRQQHGLTLGGSFAAYHGVAVSVALPISLHDRRVWGSANDMRFDPDVGVPTMVDGSELPADVLSTSPSSRNHVGPGDLRFGVRAVVFAQEGLPNRVAPANLAFDLDVRLPTGGNHDKLRDNGTAGPGGGGAGLSIGLTASRRMQGVEPYVSLAFEHNGAYRQVLTGPDGNSVLPPSDPSDPSPDPEGRWVIDPAERFMVRFGAELLATQDVVKDSEVRLDVGAGFTYVGPDEISSGRPLPAPLDPTVGHLAVTGEHIVAEVGIGLRIRPISLIETRIDFGGAWHSPHTLERVGERMYGAETAPDTFSIRWGVAVRARIR